MHGNLLLNRKASDPPRVRGQKPSATPFTREDSARSKFNILALDGGGMRGIIECAIVEEIEKRTGKRVFELFDLIVGVSTGAILAVGAIYQSSATRGRELYKAIGPQVFGKKKMLQALTRDHKGVYNSTKLKEELTEEFGSYSLMDPSCKNPRVKVGVISSEFITSGSYKVVMFRNYEPKRPDAASRFSDIGVVDSLMASSAAPLYLDAAVIKDTMFFDGGLITNNPALEALMEAKLVFGKHKQFTLLSLGTGTMTSSVRGDGTDLSPASPLSKASASSRFLSVSDEGKDRKRALSNGTTSRFSLFRSLKDENNNGVPDNPLLENIKKLVDAIGQSDHLCDTVEKYIASSCDDNQVEYFRLSPPGLGNYDLSVSDPEVLDTIFKKTQDYIKQNPDLFDRLIRSILKSNFTEKELSNGDEPPLYYEKPTGPPPAYSQ